MGVPVELAPCTTSGPRPTLGRTGATIQPAGPAFLLIPLMMATGCVHAYHPLSGLHDPIVVNPQLPNFDDLSMTVRCVPGDYLSGEDNSLLCQNVGRLFENQGADVQVVEFFGEDAFQEDTDRETTEEEAEPKTDLVLELQSRLVHRNAPPLSWIVFLGSFTVLPGITEQTFAVEATVRDDTGFLLVTDTMQGRLVTRSGVGAWLFNRIGDLGRAKEARLTRRVASADLSGDLHRQLSQQVFDAKLQWRVLQESNRPVQEVSP